MVLNSFAPRILAVRATQVWTHSSMDEPVPWRQLAYHHFHHSMYCIRTAAQYQNSTANAMTADHDASPVLSAGTFFPIDISRRGRSGECTKHRYPDAFSFFFVDFHSTVMAECLHGAGLTSYRRQAGGSRHRSYVVEELSRLRARGDEKGEGARVGYADRKRGGIGKGGQSIV